MGPVPQSDVFVNDSAYRAHRFQALPNLAITTCYPLPGKPAVQQIREGHRVIILSRARHRKGCVLQPERHRHGHADAETGRFKPLAKGDGDSVPGVVGSDRCPAGEPDRTATPQAGNDTVTPTPGTETGATPTAKATPGLTALLCLVCLTLAVVAVKRRKR